MKSGLHPYFFTTIAKFASCLSKRIASYIHVHILVSAMSCIAFIQLKMIFEFQCIISSIIVAAEHFHVG